MSNPLNFRVLEAALGFSVLVHEQVATFDASRGAHLRSQLIRAADSVAANIAEGARGTPRQLANHIRIARGSADEVGAHLRLARRLGMLGEPAYWRCENRRILVCKMLTAFLHTLDAQQRTPPTASRPH